MSLANKISSFNRRRKYQIFLETLKPQVADSILDIGFNNEEYSANDNFLEKNYPYLEKITALGIGDGQLFSQRYPQVKTLVYNGGVFPCKDKAFEIAWSNAVLEHVGDREKQIHFLQEIKRVSHKAFITTPNKNFPIEIHTRTFLGTFWPKRLFQAYLKLIGKDWANGDYMNLLAKQDIKKILNLAGIKDYQIISNRLLGLTLDFIIIF